MCIRDRLNGSKTETVYKADDKMEPVILERKEVNLSYISGEDYVFMDPEYNSYELRAEDLESVLPFIEEGIDVYKRQSPGRGTYLVLHCQELRGLQRVCVPIYTLLKS